MNLNPLFITKLSPLPTLHKRPRNYPIQLCSNPSNPPPPPRTRTTNKPSIPTSPPQSIPSPPPTSTSTATTPSNGKPPTPQTTTQTHRLTLPLGPFSTTIPTRWLLYTVPFCWGSFAPAVRLLFAQPTHPAPSVFNTERLLLSTLFYIPVLYAEFSAFLNRNSPSTQPPKSFAFFRAGLELGLFVFLANVAQVLGLQHTSASRAAFLNQLQTVIVPVLSGLFGLDKISPRTWLSSLVAVAGVALLSSDKGHGTVSSLTGDALEVLSAVIFSTYIIRLSKFCNDLPATPLVATKIAAQAFLSIGWAVATEFTNWQHRVPSAVSAVDQNAWSVSDIAVSAAVVLWTGLFSSAASGWAQTKGQQGVPPSEAVVIFATQPLWASALAALVLGESYGATGIAGGAMIIAATLIASRTGNKEDKDT